MRKEPAVSDRKARSNKATKAVRKEERPVLHNARHVRGSFLRCEPNSEEELRDYPLFRWNPLKLHLSWERCSEIREVQLVAIATERTTHSFLVSPQDNAANRDIHARPRLSGGERSSCFLSSSAYALGRRPRREARRQLVGQVRVEPAICRRFASREHCKMVPRDGCGLVEKVQDLCLRYRPIQDLVRETLFAAERQEFDRRIEKLQVSTNYKKYKQINNILKD